MKSEYWTTDELIDKAKKELNAINRIHDPEKWEAELYKWECKWFGDEE
jgi:hypothetical protein